MTRNLDMTSLRSLVSVADLGGVTRAAGFLHLTQSAVSMQLKRLEESLGTALLDRSGRTIALTAAGEQLVAHARKMLALNDEIYARLSDQSYEGEIVLGVPHDIVYPMIPSVLRRFHAEYPHMRVQLISSFTRSLKEQFDKGECDLILTTEDRPDAAAETLINLPLVWVGAIDGIAFRQRPLRLAFENRCIFRPRVQAALTTAGIPWEMAIESEQTRAIEAGVSADLAVHAMLDGTLPPHAAKIDHGGGLPDLGSVGIHLYSQPTTGHPATQTLAHYVRTAFSDTPRLAQAS